MPAFDRGQGLECLAADGIEDDGEGARAAGEDHRAATDGIIGDVVAAIGQGDRRDDLAALGKDRAAIAAIRPPAGGAEQGVGSLKCGGGTGGQAPDEGGSGTCEEAPPVEKDAAAGGMRAKGHRTIPGACHGPRLRWFGATASQSPSRAEKPAERPRMGETCSANWLCRLSVTIRR